MSYQYLPTEYGYVPGMNQVKKDSENKDNKAKCETCGTFLEERNERKRDITGGWGNYSFFFCNNCRKEYDKKLRT